MENLLHEPEQNFVVDGFLMDIVKHDHRVAREQRILVELLNEHTVSEIHNASILINSWVESNMVSNFMVIAAHLLIHSLAEGNCCYSSRHYDSNQLPSDCVPSLNQILWHLSRFPWSSLSHNNRYIIHINWVQNHLLYVRITAILYFFIGS